MTWSYALTYLSLDSELSYFTLLVFYQAWRDYCQVCFLGNRFMGLLTF